MQEIELKFQVPPAARAAVAAEVAGPDRPNRTRLQAAYFDTVDGRLAAAGLALRLRREGRRWVQTLKGAGVDGMTRAEHNVQVAVPASAVAVPQVSPARHAGTGVGDRLLALLAEAQAQAEAAANANANPHANTLADRSVSGAALVCVYGTDIWRRTRRLVTAQGEVELAFDEGHIVSGDRRVPVCELEIELTAGAPQALLDVAADWVPRHGLWLDTRTKAERGGMLARGEARAAVRRAQPVRLAGDASVSAALRAVLLSCLDQINTNASQVAAGDFAPEHVHQLRVGLRRMRTALRLFRKDAATPPPESLGTLAAALFSQLGAARDADAVAAPLALALGDALRSVGLDGSLPAMPTAAAPEPCACVRAPASQALLLGLLQQVVALNTAAELAAAGPRWRPRAAAVLKRWHRAVAADAGNLATLDDEARHELRKRAKRLRYAVEFAATLFPKKAVKAYLAPLRTLQETLGDLNDTAVGIAAFRPLARGDARALFALGWLAARREALLSGAAPGAAAFLEARPFWKT